MAVVLESLHPYEPDTDLTFTHTVPGATSIDVIWDAQTNVEVGYDYLYVTDGNDVPVQGSPFNDVALAGVTLTIPGDTVKIRLTSDGIEQRWGFAVDVIATPVVASPFRTSNRMLDRGYSGATIGGLETLVDVYNDKKIRGLYPIQGGRLLVVTEHGAYLWNQRTGTRLGSMKITQHWEDGDYEAFNTFGCSVPFWHPNVNLMSDGRVNPFGFITVRRAADSAGLAVWNIHFDPADLDGIGPVIGKFHFPRDGYFQPTDQFRLQEVTFLDGCSTSTLHAGHQDGYQPNTYLENPHLLSNRSQPFEGGSWPLDTRPNRFWDSYLVFRVLISVQNKGLDPARPWAYGPVPKAVSAYLIFANGGSRGPMDPPLKLVRVHVTNAPALFLSGDAWPGEQILRWLSAAFRNDLPYVPGTATQEGNYLYSSPILGTWGAYATQLTHNDAQWLNVHGEWPGQVWVTHDDVPGWDRENPPVLQYPDALGVGGFEGVQVWNAHVSAVLRDDWLGGLTSSKFYTVTPASQLWVPGMIVASQMDYGRWTPGVGAFSPITWADSPEFYRRYQVAVRAVAAHGRVAPDVMTAKAWLSSTMGLSCPVGGP